MGRDFGGGGRGAGGRGGGRGGMTQAPLVAPPSGGSMPSLRGRGGGGVGMPPSRGGFSDRGGFGDRGGGRGGRGGNDRGGFGGRGGRGGRGGNNDSPGFRGRGGRGSFDRGRGGRGRGGSSDRGGFGDRDGYRGGRGGRGMDRGGRGGFDRGGRGGSDRGGYRGRGGFNNDRSGFGDRGGGSGRGGYGSRDDGYGQSSGYGGYNNQDDRTNEQSYDSYNQYDGSQSRGYGKQMSHDQGSYGSKSYGNDGYQSGGYGQDQGGYGQDQGYGQGGYGQGGYGNGSGAPPPPPAPEWAEWEIRQIENLEIRSKMKRMSDDVRFRSLGEKEQRSEWEGRLRELQMEIQEREQRNKEEEQKRLQEEERTRIENQKRAGGYAAMKDTDRLKNFDWKDLKSYSEEDLKKKLEQLQTDKAKNEKEYAEWQASCEAWKKSHANHPNKELFNKYNEEWKETDKHLQHGHKIRDQKIQKLDDEIFARQTAYDKPPSPPSFVKNMRSESDYSSPGGSHYGAPPPGGHGGGYNHGGYNRGYERDYPPRDQGYADRQYERSRSDQPLPSGPPPRKNDSGQVPLPNIDFNLLKTVVSTVSKTPEKKTATPGGENEVETPSGPKPNLLETQKTDEPRIGMPNKRQAGHPTTPTGPGHPRTWAGPGSGQPMPKDSPKEQKKNEFDLSTFQPYDYGDQKKTIETIQSTPPPPVPPVPFSQFPPGYGPPPGYPPVPPYGMPGGLPPGMPGGVPPVSSRGPPPQSPVGRLDTRHPQERKVIDYSDKSSEYQRDSDRGSESKRARVVDYNRGRSPSPRRKERSEKEPSRESRGYNRGARTGSERSRDRSRSRSRDRDSRSSRRSRDRDDRRRDRSRDRSRDRDRRRR